MKDRAVFQMHSGGYLQALVSVYTVHKNVHTSGTHWEQINAMIKTEPRSHCEHLYQHTLKGCI